MKIENIKQYLIEVKNLMHPFRWYIVAYLFISSTLIHEYFFPPAKDDHIWKSEAMSGYWNYANQELYLESVKIGMIVAVLIFLLGTSNMRNHPRLAKLIFLSPWLTSLWHLLMLLLGIEMY